jgi:hypothetical protein
MEKNAGWEQFIQIYLPHLNKFYFYEKKYFRQTDVESLIAPFQTPFWIENKRWFITCEYDKERADIIYLYSLPLCKSVLKYTPKSQKISLSIDTMMLDDDSTMMDNITSLDLSLSKIMADDIQQKVCS